LRARGEWAPKVAACVHTLDAGIFADLTRLRPVIDALVAPNRLIAAAGVEVSGLAPERVFYAPYRVDAGDERDGRGLRRCDRGCVDVAGGWVGAQPRDFANYSQNTPCRGMWLV